LLLAFTGSAESVFTIDRSAWAAGLVLRRIETLLLPLFAVAKSGFVSPMKSPTATETGPPPTPKLTAVEKPPKPVPVRTETLLLLRRSQARQAQPPHH